MMAANKQTQSSRSFFHRGTITTALFWLCLMTLSLHTLTMTRTHGFVVLPSTTCGRRIGASVASTPTASSPSQQQQQPPPVSPSHTTAMAMVRKKKQQPLGSIDEDEDKRTTGKNAANRRQRKQQLGAVAVVVVGVVYDFFITHQGVGFWDPNYVV